MFSEKVRGILTVCGGILVHLTLGTVYTFGNMNPYLTSYLRSTSNRDLEYSDSIWIFAVAVMSHGSMMWFGGILHKTLGTRATCTIGSLIFSLSVFMTYFAIKESFTAVVFTYGFFFGVGVGSTYSAPLACAMTWFPNHKGLVNGLIVSGFGTGALVIDQVQTQYINPENFEPNETTGHKINHEKYFTQHALLNRVPSAFLMLGGIYTAMQILGIILLSDRREQTKEVSSSTNLINSSDEDNLSVIDRTEITEDMHPKSILKESDFWILWLIFLANGQCAIFISSSYKAYGETFIANDHLLSVVGSFAAIFNGGGRIFWGYLADRYSFRLALRLLCSLSVFLLLTFKLTEMAGSWMYFIWVCSIFGTFAGNFSLFPTIIAKLYGQKYFTINYGLLFSSQVVGGPIIALVSEKLSDAFGWFGLFCFIAGFSFIGLILLFFLKAKKPNGEYI